MINQFWIILILYLILNQVIQYYNDIDSKDDSVAINENFSDSNSDSEPESESESDDKKKQKKKK